MPELPEVETTCRGLLRALKGQRIQRAKAYRADLRGDLPQGLERKLSDRVLRDVHRRAKYIIMELDSGQSVLLHLGMSGRLLITAASTPRARHDHIVLDFADGQSLRFNDPRRFGMLDLCATAQLAQHQWLQKLGVEPLSEELTADYLRQKFLNKTASIKAALLDQRIIAGLGNIYGSEALYHARIRPTRKAGTLKPKEIAALIPAIRQVLQAAIKAGGSSLRDYVQTDGKLGYFQERFAVYDRAARSCPDCSCGRGAIRQITQAGRSSYFCPVRQK
jgi:formamidopyrimidine-DNA glycosylase